MLVVSNHILDQLTASEGVIVRVNVAWIKSAESLKRLLQGLYKYDVFLDYPEGRTKPPRPSIGLDEVLELIKRFRNIRYFAISNAEDDVRMAALRGMVPLDVIIVPKIESEIGIKRMIQIMGAACTNIAMLDKEDVYTSVKADQYKYNKLVKLARDLAKKYKKTLLELEGVVFREHREPK